MKVKVKKYLESKENSQNMIDVSNVYLADINYATSKPATDHHGPIMISQYIWARKEGDGYSELFSGMELDTEKANVTLNSPIVTIGEHISELQQPGKKGTTMMSKAELYEYLLIKNAERQATALRETHFQADHTPHEFY